MVRVRFIANWINVAQVECFCSVMVSTKEVEQLHYNYSDFGITPTSREALVIRVVTYTIGPTWETIL